MSEEEEVMREGSKGGHGQTHRLAVEPTTNILKAIVVAFCRIEVWLQK